MNWKPSLVISAAAAVAVGVILSFKSNPGHEERAVSLFAPTEEQPVGELTTDTDHEAIFKRAFWRRPGAEDRIVHAGLSEWSENGDVSRWQWFIEVEPGPELKRWLRERNPFSLVGSEAKQLPASATLAPEWFPISAGEFEVRQSPDGRMSLLFHRDRNVLFATDSGYGFAKGQAEPKRPVVKIESTGRLPLTSPPDPRQP